jgi:hypothetical protein
MAWCFDFRSYLTPVPLSAGREGVHTVHYGWGSPLSKHGEGI